MSDLLFSIRFGTVFWQLTKEWKISVRRSSYYVNNLKHQPKTPWFKVYVLFAHHFN